MLSKMFPTFLITVQTVNGYHLEKEKRLNTKRVFIKTLLPLPTSLWTAAFQSDEEILVMVLSNQLLLMLMFSGHCCGGERLYFIVSLISYGDLVIFIQLLAETLRPCVQWHLLFIIGLYFKVWWVNYRLKHACSIWT